ncbi:hypothetical protein [Sphingomonas sp.]|uniref:hypothetical protein n=1 Tax=Sphingomonas sp. TaxID=28214 RepID=UPI0031D8F040
MQDLIEIYLFSELFGITLHEDHHSDRIFSVVTIAILAAATAKYPCEQTYMKPLQISDDVDVTIGAARDGRRRGTIAIIATKIV